MILIFVLFILFDLLFFYVNRSFLNNTIRNVQGKSPRIRYAGAVLCYLALTFLLYTHLHLDSIRTFCLGASVYAVYEGTNYAIFDQWPASMVLLDTLWGGLLFLLVKQASTIIHASLGLSRLRYTL
jgi:uncharacterized membrane protein